MEQDITVKRKPKKSKEEKRARKLKLATLEASLNASTLEIQEIRHMLERKSQQCQYYAEKYSALVKDYSELESKCSKVVAKDLSDASVQTDEYDFEVAHIWNLDQSTSQNATVSAVSVSEMVRNLVEDHHRPKTLESGGGHYVLDQASGMYYETSTGYYYDPGSGMYYHGATDQYYYYDQESGGYVSVSADKTKWYSHMFKRRRYRQWAVHYNFPVDGSLDPEALTTLVDMCTQVRRLLKPSAPTVMIEEGEYLSEEELEGPDLAGGATSDDTFSDASCSDVDMPLYAQPNMMQDAAGASAGCAPCIRVVVVHSDCLEVGALYIITINGAKFGSDASVCDICLQSDSIRAEHCHVTYNQSTGGYQVQLLCHDLEGVALNHKPFTKADEVRRLDHGDRLRIWSTIFLLHIHRGSNTCPSCEPGLLAKAAKNMHNNNGNYKLSGGRESDRRQELSALKRRFGLQGPQCQTSAQLPDGYTDRAKVRRRTKGSEAAHHKEHTESSTVLRSIATDNKGFKMLQKMGWLEGDSLGLTNEGIKEPIGSVMHVGSGGLGSDFALKVGLDDVPNLARKQRWMKAQNRYKSLNK